MATLIKAEGTEQEVHPRDGKAFQLDELYALIGNGCRTVQAVYLADNRSMYCDEESKIRRPQGTSHVLNEKATKLLAEAGGMLGDVVLGNVLICANNE